MKYQICLVLFLVGCTAAKLPAVPKSVLGKDMPIKPTMVITGLKAVNTELTEKVNTALRERGYRILTMDEYVKLAATRQFEWVRKNKNLGSNSETPSMAKYKSELEQYLQDEKQAVAYYVIVRFVFGENGIDSAKIDVRPDRFKLKKKYPAFWITIDESNRHDTNKVIAMMLDSVILPRKPIAIN